VFEEAAACTLARVEPERAVTDLNWTGSLALEAGAEASAEVVCGDETIELNFAAPARLNIELAGTRETGPIHVGERFLVRARLFGWDGSEIEVGKFTTFDWKPSVQFEVANSASAGEFGACDTCFGMYAFRALTPGEGQIEARLGSVSGVLKIVVGTRGGEQPS
jgi:hypothetical protein